MGTGASHASAVSQVASASSAVVKMEAVAAVFVHKSAPEPGPLCGGSVSSDVGRRCNTTKLRCSVAGKQSTCDL